MLLGAPWLSKALAEYVGRAAAQGARVVAVDPWGQWADPSHVVSEFHRVDGRAWVEAASRDATVGDPEWLARWEEAERRAQAAIDEALGGELSEPLVARMLARHAAGSTIMASASMPMRDLEWFAPALPAPPTVYFNHGANGIDGVVSTALGLAASGRPTFALLGDLAFLHDVSGLVNLADVPCTLRRPRQRGRGHLLVSSPGRHRDPRTIRAALRHTTDVGRRRRGAWLRAHRARGHHHGGIRRGRSRSPRRPC